MINPQLIALINEVLADKDPINRIQVASELAQGFGRLVFMPSVALEQMITTLEADSKNAAANAPAALRKILPPQVDTDALTEMAIDSVGLTIETLRIFLKHRDGIVADFMAYNPDGVIPD